MIPILAALFVVLAGVGAVRLIYALGYASGSRDATLASEVVTAAIVAHLYTPEEVAALIDEATASEHARGFAKGYDAGRMDGRCRSSADSTAMWSN